VATGVINFNDGFQDTPGFRLYAEVPNYSERRVIHFASPFADTQAFYKGAVIRTAIGSGSGSSSVVVVRIVPRTATGSGTGTSSVAYIEIIPRSATGSGVGSSGGGATGLHIAPRTASGSGTGSGSGNYLAGRVRSAVNIGYGSSSTTSFITHKRTITNSGTGTQTAVGARVVRVTASSSGAGTQSINFYKVMFFRPPTDDLVSWYEEGTDGIALRLFRFFQPTARGRNVYKLTDGTFTEAEQNDSSVVEITYHGGHANPVTQAEKDDLVAAGYGAYVT
jgi:hypothetical protein